MSQCWILEAKFGNTGFATVQLAVSSFQFPVRTSSAKHRPRQWVLVEPNLNYCFNSNHQLSQVRPQSAHAAGQEKMETDKHQVLKWMEKVKSSTGSNNNLKIFNNKRKKLMNKWRKWLHSLEGKDHVWLGWLCRLKSCKLDLRGLKGEKTSDKEIVSRWR